MAGIGFRLRRLMTEGGASGWLRAHVYGAVISSGPWLLSVLTLAALAMLSQRLIAGRDQVLFRAIVIYTYLFSLISTGAFQMIVTRHLADCLYDGNRGAFLTAYRWTGGGTALLHAALALIFYTLAPDLPLGVRLLGPVLFVVVACTWVVMVFVSALRDYMSVVAAYFAGSAISVGAGLWLGVRWGMTGYLGGFAFGQTLILFFLHARIEREFLTNGPLIVSGLRRAFRRYPALGLAGFLYYAGIAIDQMLFWTSAVGYRVHSWFFASEYDTPLFVAYVSVVPALAIFLVSLETDFYDVYRQYYGVVIKHGTLNQILTAKDGLAATLREGLTRLGMVQGPITLLLIVLAPLVVQFLGMRSTQLSILRVTLVGAALHAIVLFGTLVLSYFDRPRAIVEVSFIFFFGNLGLTLISLGLGPRFYGYGYALAALVACASAYIRLERTLHELEYLTFASQRLPAEPSRA